VRRRTLAGIILTGAIATAGATVGLVDSPGVGGAVKTAKASPPLYISMGDSYSVGYQNPMLGNTAGFTGWVAMKKHLQLENFGCGGATTESLTTQIGCPAGASAAFDPVAYPTTDQVTAVLGYIAQPANYGRVALITLSISGNDVTACAGNPDPVTCVGTAATTIQSNVTAVVSELDAALTANGDTTAHIVGTTYPDVILGDWVYPVGGTNPVLAAQSVFAFDALINPALSAAYTSVARGAFVNVTTARYGKATAGAATGSFDLATGSYTGPSQTLPGFGKNIPAPVAEVCNLTYFCSILGDIHANTKGYNFIGKLIVAKLATL